MNKQIAEQLWCPLARVLVSAGDARAVINRDTSGAAYYTCKCLTDRCMMWMSTSPDAGDCGLKAGILLGPLVALTNSALNKGPPTQG